LSLEPLEDRRPLSNIPQWNDVSSEQQNIAAAFATVMRGQSDQTLPATALETLPQTLAQNTELDSLFSAGKLFVREQGELKTATAKADYQQSHIAEEEQQIESLRGALTAKRTVLEDAQAALQQCKDAEPALVVEIQRLTNLSLSLQTELQKIPGQISALKVRIAQDQNTLKATTTQRQYAEKAFKPLLDKYNTASRNHDGYGALLIRYPTNKMYQRQHDTAQQTMNGLQPLMKPYQATIASYKAKEAALTASITANRNAMMRLQVRQQALPTLIMQTQAQCAVARAALDANRIEQGRLDAEVANRKSAVDAAIIEEGIATDHLTLDQAGLTTLLAQEQNEAADVLAVHDAVDAAIEQVMAEGDPVVPEEEPVAPAQYLTTQAALSSIQETAPGILTADLPDMGGNVAFQSWQGRSSGQGLTGITGEQIRNTIIAASLTPERVNAEPAFGTVMGLQAGKQIIIDRWGDDTVTKNVPGLGAVFISVRDGVHQRYVHFNNGLIGGWEQNKAFGQTDMSITFRDGPQYIQWIDVQFTTGLPGCRVYVEDESGNVRILTAAGSGPVVIDQVVHAIGLLPSNDCGLALRAIETESPEGPTTGTETWIQSQGALLGVDLHHAGKAVNAADLSVLTNRPGTRVTAHVYRGDTEVAVQDVAADGSLHVEAESGFTGLFLENADPNATLTVRSLVTGGWSNGVPLPADTPTPINNRTVSLVSAPQWEHGTFNWAEVQSRLGVQGQRGGYENHVHGGVLFAPGTQLSTTQYTRFDLRPTSGDASIEGVQYTDFDGLHAMPADWYQIIGGKTVILTPGGPQHIVLAISGNGTFDIGHALADRASEITPSQAMRLRSTVLVVRNTGPAEGFCAYPAGVSSENAHTTAGGTVNMFYGILNDGLGGGPITVRIRLGQTGTVEDPIVRTFTGNLGGMQSLGLSVNVTLDHDFDVASMEVLGSDGQSAMTGWTVRPPHEDGGTTLTPAQRTKHLARAGRRVETAMNLASDSRIVAIWTSRSAPKPTDKILIAKATTQTLIDAGIGGMEEDPEQMRLQFSQEADALFDENDLPLYDAAKYIPTGVNTLLYEGKIYVGIVQRLLPHVDMMATHPTNERSKGIAFDPAFDSFYYFVKRAAEELNMPWDDILDAADVPASVATQAGARAQFEGALQEVFRQAGHGAIFEAAETDVHDYSTLSDTIGNRERRERENVILNVLSQPGKFPVSSPKNWSWNIASAYHDGRSFNAIDLNLPSFSDRGQEIRSPDAGYVVRVDPAYGTLEILHSSNGTEWKSKILHLPIQPYLDGNGTAIPDKYTVQRITEKFKIGTSGETELVYGDTRIVYEKNGTTYRSWEERRDANGQWSMFGVMRDQLSAQDLSGYVGNQDGAGNSEVTATADYSPHLHYEAVDTVMGSAIDLRKLLIEPAIGLGITTIRAEDAGVDGRQDFNDDNQSMLVHWDNAIGSFVTRAGQDGGTASNPYLVLDRTQLMTDVTKEDADQHWLAYESTDISQMKRVVWKKVQFVDDVGQLQDKKTWIQETDESLRWNGTSFVPLIP